MSEKQSKFEKDLNGLKVNENAETEKKNARKELVNLALGVVTPIVTEANTTMMKHISDPTGEAYLKAKKKADGLQVVLGSFANVDAEPNKEWEDAFINTFELGTGLKKNADKAAIAAAEAKYAKASKAKLDAHTKLHAGILAYRKALEAFKANELVSDRVSLGKKMIEDTVVTSLYEKSGLKIGEFVDMFARYQKGSKSSGGGGGARKGYSITINSKTIDNPSDSGTNNTVVIEKLMAETGVAPFDTEKCTWDGKDLQAKKNPNSEGGKKPYTFSPPQWASHLKKYAKVDIKIKEM